ncbi:MAG: GDSL-type esterase/lipase family protein [Tepidisphaeraceae bacterium]
MNRIQFSLVLLAFLPATLPSPAQPADSVIFDMDTIRHRPTEITRDKQKMPAGTAELVDGKFGKAVRFTFVDGSQSGFMTAPVRATPDWVAADGFSFWVKGDGSNSWGGIEIIDKSDFALRYAYCFPIDSTEWKKIVVPWSELTPELAGPLVNARGGYAPSGFGNFWFGKWFYWRDYPAHSYTIDQVALEKKTDVEELPAVEPGLKRFREKLKSGKPVTIVTMGDSLSDTRHWANKQVLWSQLLAAGLKAKYGSEVKLINPAMGGTTLSQNLVVMPRWMKEAPSPDLVLVWFGFNDWDSGVRGPRFAEYLRTAVDRIRRQAHGSADILLLTTAPAHGRWETMKELEQAVRDVAAEKKTGLADVAAEFRKPGTPDDALKQGIWAWDKVHLGPKGHETAKDVVLRAIAE